MEAASQPQWASTDLRRVASARQVGANSPVLLLLSGSCEQRKPA